METKIAIVQFLFANKWKVLTDSLGANPALTSHEFHTSSEMLKFCSQEENCLVIANVSSKEDLIQLATFVKSSRRGLKNTVIKIVVMNATENKQFEKAIAKLGSVEILEPSVSVKALRFKMDFWMKAMRGQAKKLGALNQKSVELSATDAAPEVKTFMPAPALECESDIWLLTKESDCKRIIGRWMVKLMGPGPYVGQWNEIPNKQNIWSFQIKKAFAGQFIHGQGNWLFKGEQKPEFNWQENRWMFTGEDFELFFYDGSQSQSRVKLTGKVLTLADNSAFAKTKEALILDSFNKDLIFRQEAELLKGQSLDFENEGDLGGHLEGKLKDRQSESKGDLRGKFKEEEEKNGNLRGKVKEKEEGLKGHLEGEVKEQEDKQSDLSGKIKDKPESLKGHLEGEVKNKEEAKNDLTGKLKGEEARETHPKKTSSRHEIEKKEETAARKKHEAVTEEIESKYKGKVGEVESVIPLEKSHKQHNEKLAATWGGDVKKYTPEERAERERKELEARTGSGDLKGKNDKTEHLEAHWGGKNSSDSVNTRGHSAPGTSEVKEGSLLDLKKTDHEHQTHYKNHNEATQYEAGELGKNQYQNREDGSLGGKTSTDKLASHYGTGHTSESGTDRVSSHLGRKNHDHSAQEQNESEESSPLAGRTKTDKLKGHYGSGKKASGDLEDLKPELNDVISELEEAIDSPKGSKVTNVLPFTKPEEEKALEKLTESTSMEAFVIQDGRKHECKLDDFFDNTVIFLSKHDGFRVTKKAELDISLNYQGENTKINCDAVITSLDDDGSSGYFVTVELKEADSKMFDSFMDILKSRQENIQNFMLKAKGL